MIKRILIKKEKKQFIEELNRKVTISKRRLYFVDDLTKDFHTEFGIIKNDDLNKKEAKSSKGTDFIIIPAGFIDSFKGIKKLAQTPLLKDMAAVVAETGINKKSIVIDAGTGSGGIGCFLANYVKKVYSFDIRDDCLETAKENIKFLELKNIILKKQDVYQNIPAKNADLVFLDLPEPWKAIKNSEKSLKTGGFLVMYNPQISSTQEFVNELLKNESFLYMKTLEIINREWKIEDKIVKPSSEAIIHSGFLTIARKIK